MHFLRPFIFILDDLENVNSNCKAKIRELNVCKSELGKLSSLVEDKLKMIEESQNSETDVKQKNKKLENDLKKAKSEIDNFTTSLGKHHLKDD